MGERGEEVAGKKVQVKEMEKKYVTVKEREMGREAEKK